MPGRAESAAGYGLLVAATLIANLSYGIWQSWWVAALALSAVFLAASAPGKRSPT
jgi:hypothetical protein